MLNQEDRALLTRVQDQLIELYVARDEARSAADQARMDELQIEIDQLEERCDMIRGAV